MDLDAPDTTSMQRDLVPSDFYPLAAIIGLFGLGLVAYGIWIWRTADGSLLPWGMTPQPTEEDDIRHLGRCIAAIGVLILLTGVAVFVAIGMTAATP